MILKSYNKILMNNILLKSINQSIECKKELLKEQNQINKIINLIYLTIINGGKIFFCGNGGSMSDAQHLTAELLIRLRPKVNRKPIAAICLSMDSSSMTACSNDYNFDKIFRRPFEALVKKKDLLIVITTSGNSKNIIEVLKSAKKSKIKTIGLLGSKGGKSKKYCDEKIIVNSSNVARIQETHIFIGHYILESVENLLIKKNKI
tara:strand:- start:1326 stop:1940 length:615 start_codon:yes stop_codon:yes gene_type:complete